MDNLCILIKISTKKFQNNQNHIKIRFINWLKVTFRFIELSVNYVSLSLCTVNERAMKKAFMINLQYIKWINIGMY